MQPATSWARRCSAYDEAHLDEVANASSNGRPDQKRAGGGPSRSIVATPPPRRKRRSAVLLLHLLSALQQR